MEENKKYVVTIDGPDCTGKSTLWNKCIYNIPEKNVQIRGIISNIAYAIKYNRNVDELIELYNQNPVNYMVYLLNPINDKKLEMIYNRVRNNINNNEFIAKELSSSGDTWNDFKYFKQAIDLLRNRYKGSIEYAVLSKDYYENMINTINNINTYTIEELSMNQAIRIVSSNKENYETKAKEISEYKYITIFKEENIHNIIENLYNELDTDYKTMMEKLMEQADLNYEDFDEKLYNDIGDLNLENLMDYLDNYEFKISVSASTRLETNCDFYVKLREMKNYDSFEDLIYDDSNYYDDIIDGLKNEIGYAELDSLDIDEVR